MLRQSILKSQGGRNLNCYSKIAVFLTAGLLITVLISTFSWADNAEKTPVGVSLTLGQASAFNDDFANADNWEAVSGASIKVANGVLSVTPGEIEGPAIKLKDAVWQNVIKKLGAPNRFYLEMLIRPTGFPKGNKNIGIASHISADNTKWYYAGFNSNGRMQAGESTNLKGYQNTGDGTAYTKDSDLVYYKWRYEYDNGTINFYCNDLFMGKNDALANYQPKVADYTGPVGVYTCQAPFEIAGVRIGLLNENLTKQMVQSSDSTLTLLWKKYLRLINNSTPTAIRVGDSMNFTVIVKKANGADDTWTVTSNNPKVLSVSPASGASGGTLTVKAAGVGTANITITNGSDPGSKRSITYVVEKGIEYVDDSFTSINQRVYPNIGTSAAYTDGELAIFFDAPPTLDRTGLIFIYKYATNELVDTIKLSNAAEPAFNPDRGLKMDTNIGEQMARIEGNTLYITPHFGKLTYGTQYYVAIPSGVVTGKLNGQTFTGFSPAKRTWNFTTQAAPMMTGKIISVDGKQTSTANFRTIQAALNYVAKNKLDGMTILIEPGIYRELLTFNADLDLTLKGNSSAKYGKDVVIRYINGNAMNAGTNGRPITYFSSSKTIILLNLTLKNPAPKEQVNQAETIYFNNDAGHLVVKNCSFMSQQDTLLTKGYNWFYQSYIEGTTDFIWGYAHVSLFEDCDIVALQPGSVVCHARSLKTDKGYVFLNDRFNAASGTSLLARDMTGTENDYNNITFVNCSINAALNWDSSFQPTPHGEAGPLTGWKYYGLKDASGQPYALKSDWDYELTAADYKAGFASRALILGQPTSDGKSWVNTHAWNPAEPK